MNRFKSEGQARRFLSARNRTDDPFHLHGDHVTAREYRAARTRAFGARAGVQRGCPGGVISAPASPSVCRQGQTGADNATAPTWAGRSREAW